MAIGLGRAKTMHSKGITFTYFALSPLPSIKHHMEAVLCVVYPYNLDSSIPMSLAVK